MTMILKQTSNCRKETPKKSFGLILEKQWRQISSNSDRNKNKTHELRMNGEELQEQNITV